MAVVQSQPVWTGCGAPISTAENHELVSHASLPATAQCQNIALIVYHGASMLAKLRLKSQVFAYFDEAAFADISIRVMEPRHRRALGWLFASKGSSFLGLACDHLVYNPGQQPCITSSCERCCWLCVVGVSQNFRDFKDFQRQCGMSRITTFSDDICSASIPTSLLASGKDRTEHGTMELRCSFDGSEFERGGSPNVAESVHDEIQACVEELGSLPNKEIAVSWIESALGDLLTAEKTALENNLTVFKIIRWQ